MNIQKITGSLSALPEDLSGLFLDMDAGAPLTVWEVAGVTNAPYADTNIRAWDCRVSGMRMTAPDDTRRMTYEADNGGRVWTTDTFARFVSIETLPQWFVNKLRTPLTILWWIKPEVVPVGGSPHYWFEVYNTEETTTHLNCQYSDPNDASLHTRFMPSRRRNDTTGTNTITLRVDDGIYPNANIGTWIMLAVVMEGGTLNQRIKFFKDGGIQIGYLNGASDLYTGLTTNAGFWLGTRNVTGNYARARFRRFCMFERALSAAELNALWQTSKEAWGLV